MEDSCRNELPRRREKRLEVATVGNLRPSKLRSLSLLFRLLPQYPSGPVISDDESSFSSESSDDSGASATANNHSPVVIGRPRQRSCSLPNEGATLGGPHRSKPFVPSHWIDVGFFPSCEDTPHPCFSCPVLLYPCRNLWQYPTTAMHPNANLSPFIWLRLLPKINFCVPTWTGLFQTHQLPWQVPLNAILLLWRTNVKLMPSMTFKFR
jgi:hypothetical protein